MLRGRNIFRAGVLPQQPIIQHAACDRRCRSGAKTGVFHNHGHGNHGLVDGRKRNVQGMIAFVFGQSCCVIALVLPNGDRLRRTGFATTHILCAHEYAPAGAFFGHAHHGVFDQIDMLLFVAQIHRWLAWRHFLRLRQRVLQIQRQMRRKAGAAIHHRCQRMGQLQHGEMVVALANAQRNGLAGQPLLLLGTFVGIALPFRAGQHAPHFPIQIDAGALAEAQRLHEVVDRLNPHLISQ